MVNCVYAVCGTRVIFWLLATRNAKLVTGTDSWPQTCKQAPKHTYHIHGHSRSCAHQRNNCNNTNADTCGQQRPSWQSARICRSTTAECTHSRPPKQLQTRHNSSSFILNSLESSNHPGHILYPEQYLKCNISIIRIIAFGRMLRRSEVLDNAVASGNLKWICINFGPELESQIEICQAAKTKASAFPLLLPILLFVCLAVKG